MVKLTYLARLAVHEILRVTGGGAGSGLGSALSALVNTRHYIEATAEKGSVRSARVTHSWLPAEDYEKIILYNVTR